MRTNVEVVPTFCYGNLHNLLDFRRSLFFHYLLFFDIFVQFRTREFHLASDSLKSFSWRKKGLDQRPGKARTSTFVVILLRFSRKENVKPRPAGWYARNLLYAKPCAYSGIPLPDMHFWGRGLAWL